MVGENDEEKVVDHDYAEDVEDGADGVDPETQKYLDVLEKLLSVETVTVLQLLGFNFRQAIGEPLTQLVRRLIASRAPVPPTQRLM